MKSPLNYLGGKSKLAKTIVGLLPAKHTCYCEAFSGAAWVLFAKERSKVEVINDADGELVTFWRVIQNHLEPFLEHWKYAVVSRKIFEWERMKNPETLTDIQRACRYYYLQRLSFGGKPANRHFGTSAVSPSGLNIATIETTLLDVHWRLERVTIEHLDACVCIQRYDRPDTLFYLDPPYYGVCQDYASKFTDADYQRLRTVLDGLQGQFILSLNDCPEVRAFYAGYKMKPVTLTYSTGNSRVSDTTRGEIRKELLIHNLR